MSIMKFDTLSTVKELQSGGFEQLQAETLVNAISKITTANSEDLATKGDLKDVETALRGEIKEIDAKIDKLEASLRGEIKEIDAKIDKVEAVLSAKLDILKWIGGVIAVAAVTAAARYVFFSA